MVSLGGANGVYGFANDADAESFADTLWNIFGAGESDTRPFGDAIIDGFDLDIEGGGSTGYVVSCNTQASIDMYLTQSIGYDQTTSKAFCHRFIQGLLHYWSTSMSVS